jgi:hypothetical protein
MDISGCPNIAPLSIANLGPICKKLGLIENDFDPLRTPQSSLDISALECQEFVPVIYVNLQWVSQDTKSHGLPIRYHHPTKTNKTNDGRGGFSFAHFSLANLLGKPPGNHFKNR